MIKQTTNIDISTQIFADQIFEKYILFQEKRLKHRRFTHAEIQPILAELSKEIFEIRKIGASVLGKSISQIKIGTGPIKVLLWSQMHGNEATATLALFDIFNFFSNSDDFIPEKNKILKECTIYFVPMLNPDGADLFIRRNALGIDLNRDALRLQSPEAILLKKLQNDLQPDFGFNLHDQSVRYAVGSSGKQTTMAFLATAFNEAREINPIRKRSMQLIIGMNRILQHFIPNQVARFSDEFEPRAFGDNIQKWGTTLILVESGGYGKDIEKQYIRKLNFVTILSSLLSIAGNNYINENIAEYEAIPENTKSLFDLLIRNASTNINGKNIVLDIGINKEEVGAKNSKKFTIKSTIDDLGDLSTFFGIEEIDATGMTILSKKALNLNLKADIELIKGNKIFYKIKNGSLIKQK